MGANDLMMKLQLQLAEKVSGPLQKISAASQLNAKALKTNRDRLRELEKQNGLVQKLTREKDAFRRSNTVMRENQAKLIALKQSGTASAAQIAAQTAVVKKSAAAFDAQKSKLMQLRAVAANSGIKNLTLDERRLAGEIGKTTQTIKAQETALKRIEQLRAQRNRALALTAGAGATGMGLSMVGRRGIDTSKRALGAGFEFDTAMSALQGVLNLNANDPELKALRERILDFNVKNSKELADGIAALAQQGFKPSQLAASIQPLINMADATGQSFADTADVVGSTMKAFNLNAEQFASVTDVLVTAANRGGVPLNAMQEALADMAPTARAAGVSFEQTSAMLAAMTAQGLNAKDASTALEATFKKLQAPDAKALAALGIRNAGKSSIPELLEMIAQKTTGMSGAKQLETLNGIFGAKNAVGMNALVEQMRGGGYGNTIAALQNSDGAAAAQAAKNTNDLKNAVDDMKSALASVGTVFFEENREWLIDMAKSIRDVANSVRTWLKENPGLVSTVGKLFIGISLLLAVLGPLLTTFAAIAAPIIIMKFAIAKLGIQGFGLIAMVKNLAGVFGVLCKAILANPILALIAALAALAFAVYKNWDAVKWALTEAWEKIKGFFSWLGNIASSVVSSIWNTLTSAFSNGIAGIGELILNWSPLGLFYEAFAGVMSWFGVDLPAKFSDFGSMIIEGLVNGIKNAIGAVKDAVVGTAKSVAGWFKSVLGIKSPSRVFMEAGLNISEGAAIGIQRGLPQVRAATLALAEGTQQAPLRAPRFRFDTRAPLAARRSGGAALVTAGDNITFNITGNNPQEIAQAVRMELDRRDRERAAKARSAYRDS